MRQVTVELQLAHCSEDEFFVVVKGVPYTKGLVITNAYKREKAERIKAAVEASLDGYRRPSPDAPSGKSRFDRIE